MKKFFITLLSIVSLFISCSNFVDVGVEKSAGSKDAVYTVTGRLVSGYEDGTSSRSAFPASVDLSLYTTNIYYKESPTATQRTLCGTTTGSDFELKLPSLGTYYLEAESYITTNESKAIEFKTLQPTQITIDATSPYKDDVSLFLKVVIGESDATGSIGLYVKSDFVLNGRYEIYEGDVDVGNGVLGSVPSLCQLSDVHSGVHNYRFDFYDYTSKLVYQCTETVTVFPGKTTDTWVNNGNAEYFSTENISGNDVLVMNITQECLDNFALTNFYVDPDVTTSGNGSYFEPVKTVYEAVDKCVDSSKSYTVNVKGTVTEMYEIALSSHSSKNITIQKAPDASSAEIKYTSTTGRLFEVDPSVTLKISNLSIEGPDTATTSNGAAIYNEGTLILNNVNLSKFKQATGGDKYGGCLYNAGDGTISITGGSITSCLSAQGGAIYNAGKDIEIKDCTINSCQAGQAGGAIYNHSSAKITLSGNTLIGVDTSTKATSSSYGNASTAGQGGGIYLENGELYLKDNTVIGYNYSDSIGGGGLYLAPEAKVYLQDNASIKGCTSNSNGGGIYLGANISKGAKAFLQDNVSITSCTAVSGGGIYASSAMCRVYMKDSAYLDSASDIRLNANGYVSLNGNLTPPAAANGIAATLTPQFYDPDDDSGLGSYIQLLNSEPSGFVAGNYSKFKVKEKRSGEYVIPYTINAEGKLTGISQASLAELVSSFDSSNKYLITISDPNPDFTTLYDALKNSRSYFKLDLSQTSITTLASGSLHDMSKMIDVSFPSTLTTLEAGSIYSLSSSLTIKIPASVTTITGNPFAKVTASISVSDTSCNITLEEGNLHYKMIDGVIYTKDGKRLVCYPKSKTNTTFTIPAGVEVIGEGAFAGNSKLTEVTFNEGLKKIENYAFARLAENKKVVLPASVTSIGDYSFYSNWKLETLTITGGNTYTIGSYAFSNFGLSNRGGKDCKVTIGEGVSEIGEYAFFCCYIDTSSDDPLVLPASLTVIGGSNFRNGKANYIKSLAVNPPVVGDSGLYSNDISRIYVLNGSVDAYKAAIRWSNNSIVGF